MAYAFSDDKRRYDLDWVIDMIIKVSEAYAVFDSSDNSLTFFRDAAGKYTNGQVIETKTYYTNVETTNSRGWGSNAPYVTKVIFDAVIKPTSCERWFYRMNNLTTIENLELLNTSEVTSMADMFRNCGSLTSLGLSSFNTSKVTSMSGMFVDCDNLTSLDLSNFDTSNVTSMYSMFLSCDNLTSLDLSNFDTSNVTSMYSMFGYCKTLTQLDLSNFNTSNVTDMYGMFSSCINLTTTLTIMKMPTEYIDMCNNASRQSGQLTLKYKAPVTSANIDTLVATKGNGNVVNGGQA